MSHPIAHSKHHWLEMKRRLLEMDPTLVDDEQALYDTLDGLTELTDQIVGVMSSANMDRAFAKTVKAKAQEMRERADLWEYRAEQKRKLCLNTMIDADIKNIKSAELTVYRIKHKPKLQIIDETLIPGRFFKEVVTRSLDKAAVKTALNAGDDIHGATLGNETETIGTR